MNRRDFIATTLFTSAGLIVAPRSIALAQVRSLTVDYQGNHKDVVVIRSADGGVVQDLTLDALHEQKTSSNGAVVAVHCGRNAGGDGVVMYGLYYVGDRMMCDGVLRFVPADDTLFLQEVVSETAGATVKVITGKNRDVYSQFYFDGKNWSVRTKWYSGWQPPDVSIPFGTTQFTASDNHDPHYRVTFQSLRPA